MKGGKMTRQEAKNLLNELYVRADITDEYGGMEDMQPYEEAINMAIKALKQESILDKIRTEIMRKDGLEEALEIIDKYTSESEKQ